MYSVKWHKSKINQEQLRREIQAMSPSSKLFKLIKEELTKLGHWKQKPRGNPKAGYNKAKFGNEKDF